MKGLYPRLITLVAIPLLACCEEAPIVDTADVPLSFSTSVEAQTRGSDLTTDNLTSMGVFAFFTQGGSFNASTSKPNLLYNQEVTKAVGASSPWTYSPTRYWPANSNDKVSFFAYAPYNASGVTVSAATQAGYPKLTYTVPATEAAQTDLLLAKPIPDKTSSDGVVKFEFTHALTRVIINVEAGSGFTGITLNSLAIKTKKSGVVAFSSVTSSTDWFEWSGIASGAANDISCAATLPGSSSTIATGSTGKVATFLLLPVATAGATSENATITFSYTMNGIGDTKTVTDLALPSLSNWKANTSVTYNLKISRTGATVTTSNVSIWTGITVDVDSGGEIAEGSKAGDIKMGDYYYDDGTWSDGGYRELTAGTKMQCNVSPIEGKNCIGIVYANGKTGTGYADKIADYSGTGIATATGIKGYVIRLELTTQARRGGGGSSDQTAFIGYQNTQRLSTSVSSPRELREIIINSTLPPPSATSGWYVMSFGQMLYAYQHIDILNKSRSRVTNTATGTPYENMNISGHWTSTFSSFGICFDNGSPGNSHTTVPRDTYLSFTF